MMKKTLPKTRFLGAAVLVALTASTPRIVSAQEIPETGGRVFGLVGGSFGDGGSALLVSGGAGVRITRTLGLDFEVFHVSGLDLSDDDRFFVRPLSFAPVFGLEQDASVTAFLSKIVVDFPVGERLIPFVAGGGGVTRVSEELSFNFGNNVDGDRGLPELFRNIGRDRRPSILPRDIDRSQTGMALTLGGGVDIRLWKGLTVGAEVRWLRVLAGNHTLDLAHIGSRVAYRF
jgi:opacity protein-like surface antigen